MPTSSTLLLAVLIVGAVLSLVSTIWGMVTETSYTGADGKKRLSKSGQVAVSLAIGSALVSTTALGMRSIVDQQAAASTAQKNAETQARGARLANDNKHWQQLMTQQQVALADLGIKETKIQGARAVSNQTLLAAIEDQRARAIAGEAKLFQISQSQLVILKSQALASLHVRLIFGGFNQHAFAPFANGLNAVLAFRETDDDYGRMIDALPALDNANLLEKVVAPLIRQYFSGVNGLAEDPDLLLVVDLDGTGSWLLPLGFTDAKNVNGFVLNRGWLADAGDPFGGRSPRSDVTQNIGSCALPAVAVNPRIRTVTIDWEISGACLTFAIHRSGDAMPIARLHPRPAVALFATGKDGSPVTIENVSKSRTDILNGCLGRGNRGIGSQYVDVSAVPNFNVAIGVSRRLHKVGTAAPISSQPTAYDGPEQLGACLSFE